MKRLYLALGSLVLAIALSCFGYCVLNDTCEKLKKTLDEVVYYAELGDAETALEKAEFAEKQWEKIHGKIESLINHAETDELEEIIKSLPVYARLGNTERLCEKAEIAINRLEHVVKNEKIMISNIL